MKYIAIIATVVLSFFAGFSANAALIPGHFYADFCSNNKNFGDVNTQAVAVEEICIGRKLIGTYIPSVVFDMNDGTTLEYEVVRVEVERDEMHSQTTLRTYHLQNFADHSDVIEVSVLMDVISQRVLLMKSDNEISFEADEWEHMYNIAVGPAATM